MKYNEAIAAINTERALRLLDIALRINGNYIYFPCVECGKESAIRYYGMKKNVAYCPTCKKGINIIALAAKIRNMEFQDAKKFLIEKASGCEKPIEQQLNVSGDLEWCDFMASEDLDPELCQKMGVGKWKGKGIMAGHVAFTVHNEHGVKVAYYGIHIPDKKAKFPSNFNPELYLYNYHNINHNEEVWITKDMFNCLRIIQSGRQSVCNFGLPYLSVKQYQLLSDCDRVVFDWSGDKRDIAFTNIASLKTFYRFA